MSAQKQSWKKPDFEEIALCMEVTAYANTEDELPLPVSGDQRHPTSQTLVDEQPAE
ncbi:pyrroloquinoline quinone precursor peptide PqqA [Pirellulales bacterium]|nr:pyrroloquinoline quinone precursor peptide PqqA [Pirellulales bacterium]